MTTQIVGKTVGKIGYGMMSLTTANPPLTDAHAIACLKAALNSGCNLWNGGEFYGPPERNSLYLLNKYFEKYPEDADKVVLNIKGCTRPQHIPDGSDAFVRHSVQTCIDQMGSRGRIHMFESARRDVNTPLEETYGTFGNLVKEGKIDATAISEVSAKTIREAAAVTKISAVEVELSLFSTDPLTNGIVDACAELGIPILAYSPVGKGFLTGQIKSLDDIPAGSMLRMFPRFQPDTFDVNLKLVCAVEALAKRKACTPAQLALNWVRALSDKPGFPTIIPIPGSSNEGRIAENSKIVHMSDADMKELDDIMATFEVAGERYPEAIHKLSGL